MAAAGAGGGGNAEKEQYFKPENVYIIIGHGYDPGDRRFFVRPGHHITLPRRCGSEIFIDLKGIEEFFASPYNKASVPVPTIRTDLHLFEKSIPTLGFNFHATKAAERKLYRSEFRNRNPEYSINEAFGRFTAPDILISFFYLEVEGSDNHFVVTPDGVEYDDLTQYIIKLTGIYKNKFEPSLADIEQTIAIPEVKNKPVKTKFSGRIIFDTSEDVLNKYAVGVLGTPGILTKPIKTFRNPVERNFLSVIQDTIGMSFLQYIHLIILWFFRTKKRRELTADELVSAYREIITGLRSGQELEEIPITSVRYIDNEEIDEDYFYDDYYEEYNENTGEESYTSFINLDITDLTLNDLINLKVRLSFLMDFIALHSLKQPILVHVHACRATDLSNEERRERVDASENEGYSAAATRRRSKKKQGGISRHRRKQNTRKRSNAAAYENNE